MNNKFKISFRTKKLLKDAKNLQKNKFYSNSILSYSHYLEQILLSSSILHLRSNPDEAENFLLKILQLTDKHKLTLGKIMRIIPNEILKNNDRENCEKIRNIRNVVGGHHFFAVGVGYNFLRMEETEYYKKIIRRLYKMLKDDGKNMSNVEVFLKMHPLTFHSRLEKIITDIEDEIMDQLCKKMEKLVIITTISIYNNAGPLGRFN